ncbi:hypothetical protein ACVNF4_08155 [Streptomyces sp. S6]
MITPWEVAVAQAEMTAHLTLYTQAPIAEDLHVRGVLPAPAEAPAVRIALGAKETTVGDLLAIYELPLLREDETLSPWDAVGRVRHEVRFHSNGKVDEVLGTPLIQLPTPVPPTEQLEDRAHTLLTTLSCPHPSFEDRESAETLLIGFLYLRDERMRLYVRRQTAPEIIACDVRIAEAGPAVTAEVFSCSGDWELWEDPGDDPHCTAVLDLTH